jgi:pimeloyl-ACP methyl ester carboxylesterase
LRVLATTAAVLVLVGLAPAAGAAPPAPCDPLCQQRENARYAGLTGGGLVRPGYLAEPHFARFLAANSVGFRPVGGPVLLLQGDADQAIPAAITDRVAAGLCRTGSVVDYRTFPGLGHDTIPGVVTGIDDGAADQILAWVADRFAGRPTGSTCTERRNQP